VKYCWIKFSIVKISMKHFKSLIKELHLNKPKLAHFTNKPGTKQSSVAVIFRINKPEAYFEKFR
jgi:hypothetical protein